MAFNPKHPFKYRITSYGLKIEKVEIEKESEHFIWPVKRHGYREAKHSSFDQHFDSFDQAKAALISRAEAEIEYGHDKVRRAENDLQTIKALREDA